MPLQSVNIYTDAALFLFFVFFYVEELVANEMDIYCSVAQTESSSGCGEKICADRPIQTNLFLIMKKYKSDLSRRRNKFYKLWRPRNEKKKVCEPLIFSDKSNEGNTEI